MLMAVQLAKLIPQDLCQQASMSPTHTSMAYACVFWGFWDPQRFTLYMTMQGDLVVLYKPRTITN